jgi:hypothetical protein
MAKKIWKFQLQTTHSQVLEIPSGSEILTVQVQNGKPCIWALVDDIYSPTKRIIEVFGTGHTIEDGTRKYIGTYQLYSGDLVFHVFERIRN